GSSVALAIEAKQKNATARTPNDEEKSDVVFMVQDSRTMRVLDKSILCFGRLSFVLEQRVTRLELATSSLARRCSTTELHPQFLGEAIMSSGQRDATFYCSGWPKDSQSFCSEMRLSLHLILKGSL